MAATPTPIATDSAAALHGLIGEDATATFENDPKFIDSNPTGNASSENIALRDTDDTEDSDEEDDELEEEEEDDELEEEEEEDDEDDEEDDEDEDEDLDEEDDEKEFGAVTLRVTGSTNVRGHVKNEKTDVEAELEDMDEEDHEGTESIEQDVEDGEGENVAGSDSPQVDRAIDAAVRMSALAAVAAGFAANVQTWE